MNRILGALFAASLFATSALAQNWPPVPLGPSGGGGGGGGGGAGTVTSIATSCAISGGPITNSGTIKSQIVTNPQSGTSYTQLAGDCGKLVTLTNASAIAFTLSNANFVAGNYFGAEVLPSSTGAATFTPSSGTVNGLASIVMTPASPGGTFVFDGTNWEFVGSGVVPGTGTVTSVGFTGGLISVASPTTTPAFTVAGTSGGLPYFSSATTWASSAALAAGSLMQGGGAGVAPSTFTLGGDCAFSTPNITCAAINGKAVSLSAALTTTGGATTLAFGAGTNTYTFPNSSDTVVTLAATQTLTGKSIAGSEVNSGTVPMAQMPPVLGFPGYITGASMWYGNPYNTASTVGITSAAPVANSYYCVPFWIYQTVTIKALAIQITTLSAGNTNNALQGAVYNDLLTTNNVHRPGTLIDFAGVGSTTGFNTSGAGTVSTAMANGTDTITGPAMIWTCVQAFDTTVKYNAFNASVVPLFGAVLGSATLGRVLSANTNTGFSTTGTAFGGTNWVAFTSATSWTESIATVIGPIMAIQVN